MSEIKNEVIELAQFLESAKGQKVVALDVRESCVWTDYFIIVTYNSQGHLMGLLNELGAYLDDSNWNVGAGKAQKKQANEWILIDLGEAVIHLLSSQAREFYELEKLWYNSDVVFQSS